MLFKYSNNFYNLIVSIRTGIYIAIAKMISSLIKAIMICKIVGCVFIIAYLIQRLRKISPASVEAFSIIAIDEIFDLRHLFKNILLV